MGIVIRFPRHGRPAPAASAASRLSSCASASNVISGMPRSDASRAKDSQCADGMPLTRQTLTVGSASTSASATAFVPPKASITESDVIMERKIVCTMQTSQGFATRQPTFLPKYVAMRPMTDVLDPLVDPPEVVAKRLEALRKRYGINTQSEWAEKLGIDKSTYSLMKKGERNLSFPTACRIRREYGISVDWLFFGDLKQSAFQIMADIGRGDAEAAEKPKPLPSRKQRKRA